MTVLRHALAGLALTMSIIGPVHAASEFPFGSEMTLETRPQPGSKRIPTLEIGDNGKRSSTCGASPEKVSSPSPTTLSSLCRAR
jgi:hypothetical protein